MNKKDNLLTKRLEDNFILTVTRRYSVKTALLRIIKIHRKKPVLNIGFFLFFPAYFLRTHFFPMAASVIAYYYFITFTTCT